MARHWTWIGATLAALVLCACDAKTETGYQPRKLEMTDSQRKALYADPFTSDKAESDHDRSSDFHRPGEP